MCGTTPTESSQSQLHQSHADLCRHRSTPLPFLKLDAWPAHLSGATTVALGGRTAAGTPSKLSRTSTPTLDVSGGAGVQGAVRRARAAAAPRCWRSSCRPGPACPPRSPAWPGSQAWRARTCRSGIECIQCGVQSCIKKSAASVACLDVHVCWLFYILRFGKRLRPRAPERRGQGKGECGPPVG